MTDAAREPAGEPDGNPRERHLEGHGAGRAEGHGRPADQSDEDAASLPVLLEAVLSVGSELELRATLQHIVDSAAELCSARYVALGIVDPARVRVTPRVTAGRSEGA
ncbi:hypothetical protein ACFCYA_34495, partial [Streptomyces virginiae]